MAKTKPNDLAQNIDGWLRAGQWAKAKQALRQLGRKSLSRPLSLLFAPLYRRAGLPEVGVALLNPFVRPSRGSTSPATDAEKVEYATCLLTIGANEEAGALLDEVNARENPEALLSRGFCYVARWDYESAIPAFRAYLSRPGRDPYMKLVAETNLSAALVADEHFDEAERCIGKLLAATASGKMQILHGAILQQALQASVLQKEWAEARRRLKAARDFFSVERGNIQRLLVDKWAIYAELFHSGGMAKSLEALESLRRRAYELRHWETIRDCDRFEALAKRDEKLATHIYFGTPWPKYKQRLRREFSISSEYRWQLGEMAGKPRQVNADEPMKVGQLRHRAFTALTSDFYRPLHLAALHHRVYPGEFYNPYSTPVRVRKALSRLRQWLAEERLPLTVHHEDRAYRLEAKAPVEILLREKPAEDRAGHQLDQIRMLYQNKEVTRRQIADALEISASAVHRLLRTWQEKSEIGVVGNGRSSRYRLKG